MSTSAQTRRWPARVAGLAAVALLLLLVAQYWHPVYGFTAFIQLDAPNDDLKIPAFREHPVYVHRHTGGYDGLYYAQIAYYPALNAPELARAMDNFAYRARRILPSALAWLLAAGQPAWIVHVYSVLNIAAWLILAALLWRLLAVKDARGYLAWAGVMFSAGALASVRLALTDLPALTILTGALLAAERGRAGTASGALAAAGLARETSLLALAGLWERPWLSWKNFRRAGIVAVPLAAWLAYVRWRVGPADQGWSNFTWPGAGFLEKWRDALAATATVADQVLAWTTVLATLGLTVQAAFFLARFRPDDRWWRMGAAYTAMMLCLGTAVWEGFPGAVTRVLLPLTLAFNLVAHRTRAPLVWLLAGNLTVFAGFAAMRDASSDPRELAAARSVGVAGIVNLGDGWFNLERSGFRKWAWSGGHGIVQLETWPKQPLTLQLDFEMRSVTPRTVFIRQDGREIWRAPIGRAFSKCSVRLQLAGGRGALEFATDEPAVLENANPGARLLGFALYYPRLSVSKP